MIQSILVVGGGSAGLLAALLLRNKSPNLKVTVVRSVEIGVIGVGESTTGHVTRVLHADLDLDQFEFYRRVLPSWKLGVRFLWGPREYFDYTFSYQIGFKWRELPRCNGYYCYDDFTYVDPLSSLMSEKKVFQRGLFGHPVFQMYFGYHIENRRFVAYLEDMAVQRGITLIDGVVTHADRDDHGITSVHLHSGQALSADLYVDCTGFRSLLIGDTLKEPYTSFKSTLFCDRALVGSWMRTDEVINPYTTAETMSAGWCWQIDHPDCINRGYVYSSSFISDEEAEREFRQKNPKIDDARVVHFTSGRFDRLWVKNVVAIGNAGAFVEPLESTGLAIICSAANILAGCLDECCWSPRPTYVKYYNQLMAKIWDITRDFLGVHYKFNTRYDTPFWKAVRADTELGRVQDLIDFYQENGPSPYFRSELTFPNDMFAMEGYYALLIGQKVPHRGHHTPTAEEKKIWEAIRARNRADAENGVGAREALDLIMQKRINWNKQGLEELKFAGEAKVMSYVDHRY